MTRYSISQPYNVHSHNTDVPCSSDSKSACIYDKSEDKSCLDKDCTAVYKLCLIGDHHIPNLCMPFKHNHIPCQDNHHSHFKHCHQPCHSSHDAAWYHAHDSGNTVVLNIPPYWGWGTGTGIRTGIGATAAVETEFGTHEVVKTGEASLGSVDKILEKPYKSSNKIEKTHKNLSSLVKSRKNAPKVLDFSKEAFNQMTFFVDMLIVIPLYFSIPSWWNNYYTSLALKTCNKSITIVAFISHYSRVIDIFG